MLRHLYTLTTLLICACTMRQNNRQSTHAPLSSNSADLVMPSKCASCGGQGKAQVCDACISRMEEVTNGMQLII